MENMPLLGNMSSSVSIILLDCNKPRHTYWTSSTLLVSPGLSPWLILFSWSFRSFSVTSTRTLNKWKFSPLKRTWALNKLSIVSDQHHKKLNNHWKTHSNILTNTWSANYTYPKTQNYNINLQTSKQLSNISHLHVNNL